MNEVQPSKNTDLVVLTQEQVAERFGVTRAAVSLVERNAIAKLRRAIEQEAAAAGVSVREWVFGDEA